MEHYQTLENKNEETKKEEEKRWKLTWWEWKGMIEPWKEDVPGREKGW